jgi:hypothetical protein
MKDIRLRTGEYTLGEALEKMLDSYKLKEGLHLTQIKNHWEEIAGKTIHKYTSNLYVRNKNLYIYVNNAALRQELHYMKASLIEAVNNYFKKNVIEDIVIN